MQDKNFKNAAKEAKQRFRQGYWESFLTDSKDKVEKLKANGFTEADAKKVCAERAKNEIKIKYSGETEESLFYQKVCDLLASEEILLNPLKKLIDHEVYNNLTEAEKQNYMLRLAEKFAQMKERFEREKQQFA